MKRLILTAAAVSGIFAARAEPAPQAKAAASLPDFTLTEVTTARTRRVSRRDFEGKIWIADFMFTRCHGTCPLNSAKMERLQAKLPKDIHLASFTVDPTFDQAKALRAYAKSFHARPDRWVFLTAKDEATLIPLFKGTFKTAYRKNAASSCGYETYHSTKFFLIGPRGDIRGEYTSEDSAQMKRLEADALALERTSVQPNS